MNNSNYSWLKINRSFLKTLSNDELFVFADLVSLDSGEEILKDADREQAIENKLASELDSDYLDDLEPIAAIEIAKLPAENVEMTDVEDSMNEISKKMDKRSTKNSLELLIEGSTAIATISRKSQLTHIQTIDSTISITAGFSQADLAAIKELSKQQLWWIGDHWDNNLSRIITATVQEESLVTGLGREQVGKILKGIVKGSVRGVSVPGTFAGSTEQYFQMLSATVRTRASAFGALTSMRDAGFSTYKIVAVMDERTSEQCRLMHNKVFKVSDGMGHMNRSLKVTDPDGYKAVAGWKSASAIEQIIGSGDANSQRMNLAASGLALPPYHARCRTIVMAES